jgi:hypothetical protein
MNFIHSNQINHVQPQSSDAAIDGVENGNASSNHSLQQIREALFGLQFGSVHVIVQDGVIIQIERTDKVRVRNKHRV